MANVAISVVDTFLGDAEVAGTSIYVTEKHNTECSYLSG